MANLTSHSLPADLYIGLMSGTSMDGVDAVLAAFPSQTPDELHTLACAHLPFPDDLLDQLHALQTSGPDELHREAIAANALAELYARAVQAILGEAGIAASSVTAIGAHGQTVRHRPELGYTRQISNPALLAELTGIDVVADLRSRDIAAGGQGAPLVPAFHRAVFSHTGETRVLANIGGIANISVLRPGGEVTGFDTGPGNVLLDLWCNEQLGKPYDANGAWAASGAVLPHLLDALLDEPYLRLPPPKSTGRDLFNADWLQRKLAAYSGHAAVDIQATLSAFTAATLADAIHVQAPDATTVFICGGGAYNAQLLVDLERALIQRGIQPPVKTTEVLGVPPQQVEALAFAWLAQRHVLRQSANLPSVTGARGPRILGALYPA